MSKTHQIAQAVEAFAYLFGMVVLFRNLQDNPELWCVLVAVCCLLVRLFVTNEKAESHMK